MNKFITTLLFLLGACTFIYSQKSAISGTVTDEKGTPLIAAAIGVGQEGTITDLDGNFKLNLQPGTHEITVSYVGYDTKAQIIELKADENASLKISLKESFNLLETATVTCC